MLAVREDIRNAPTSSLLQELGIVGFIFPRSYDVVHLDMEHVHAPQLLFHEPQRNDNPASEVDQQSPDVTTNAPVESNENAQIHSNNLLNLKLMKIKKIKICLTWKTSKTPQMTCSHSSIANIRFAVINPRSLRLRRSINSDRRSTKIPSSRLGNLLLQT